MVIAAILLTTLRFMLIRENNRLASVENENSELSEKDMIRLQRTAETEGISIAQARQLQKGFRYPI